MIEAVQQETARADTAPPLLEVNNIEVVYSEVILVLRGLSLVVPQGEIVALLGANGAGKSSTLKAISGLVGAERGDVVGGRILYRGADVTRVSPDTLVRDGLVQVLEGRHCFAHLSVEENLLIGGFVNKPSRQQLKVTKANREISDVALPLEKSRSARASSRGVRTSPRLKTTVSMYPSSSPARGAGERGRAMAATCVPAKATLNREKRIVTNQAQTRR